MTPNPGSPEAVAQGCICPRMDNGHGRGYAVVDGVPVFAFHGDCPLHQDEIVEAVKATVKENRERRD